MHEHCMYVCSVQFKIMRSGEGRGNQVQHASIEQWNGKKVQTIQKNALTRKFTGTTHTKLNLIATTPQNYYSKIIKTRTTNTRRNSYIKNPFSIVLIESPYGVCLIVYEHCLLPMLRFRLSDTN